MNLHLEKKLDELEREEQQIYFWWRSDDMATISPTFEKLVEVQNETSIPLALSAIPLALSHECLRQVINNQQIEILQHGFSHKNYGSKEVPVELGGKRGLYEILTQLKEGLGILFSTFEKQFVPVLVPPWHTISAIIIPFLEEIGFLGLSLNATSILNKLKKIQNLPVHLDLIDWSCRKSKAKDLLLAEFLSHLNLNHSQSPLPPIIGVVTHHQYQSEESLECLKQLIHTTKNRSNIKWITTQEYLRLLNL